MSKLGEYWGSEDTSEKKGNCSAGQRWKAGLRILLGEAERRRYMGLVLCRVTWLVCQVARFLLAYLGGLPAYPLARWYLFTITGDIKCGCWFFPTSWCIIYRCKSCSIVDANNWGPESLLVWLVYSKCLACALSKFHLSWLLLVIIILIHINYLH